MHKCSWAREKSVLHKENILKSRSAKFESLYDLDSEPQKFMIASRRLNIYLLL